MTRDDIISMAREAGMEKDGDNFFSPGHEEIDVHITDLERFAQLVESALIEQGYRKCAEGQKTTQFCGMLEQAVLAERDWLINLLNTKYSHTDPKIVEAIRARGQQ